MPFENIANRLDPHAPGYQGIPNAFRGGTAGQDRHGKAVLRGSHDRAVGEQGVRTRRSGPPPCLSLGVAEAMSMKTCCPVKCGAKASALSSEAEPGVTLTIRSTASTSCSGEPTSVTPAAAARAWISALYGPSNAYLS